MKKSRKQPLSDLETIIPLLIGQWRRMTELPGPSDRLQTREFRSVVEKVRLLQTQLIEGDSLFGSDYFSEPALLGAYTLYHWIIHYQEGLSLINEIPEPPLRVLDLCSGPCPFAFAALKHGAQEVLALDKNLEALRWGAQLCGRYGYPITIRQTDCSNPFRLMEAPFDLIIIGHALRELFPKDLEASANFIHRLGSFLSPQGHLLLVDSSLPFPNRELLRLRDLLVKKGMPVQAPCIWKGSCPALEKADSPCYAQREMEKPFLVKEFQRAAGINLSSLKMSYMLFRSPAAGWPKEDNLNLFRVISPPFESHHGTGFYLCGSEGKKKLSGNPTTVTQNNKAFAHLKRGELIAIDQPIERGNTFEVSENTAIKVIAAPGKARPTET